MEKTKVLNEKKLMQMSNGKGKDWYKQARAFRGDQAKIKNRRKIHEFKKEEQVKAVKCQFMV